MEIDKHALIEKRKDRLIVVGKPKVDGDIIPHYKFMDWIQHCAILCLDSTPITLRAPYRPEAKTNAHIIDLNAFQQYLDVNVDKLGFKPILDLNSQLRVWLDKNPEASPFEEIRVIDCAKYDMVALEKYKDGFLTILYKVDEGDEARHDEDVFKPGQDELTHIYPAKKPGPYISTT